jgi:ribokinase
MKPSIVVCGSLNMDFVVRVPRLPAPGETISGSAFEMLPGGKGANQACAAGKLSGGKFHVRMLGRTGYDIFADHLKASLAAAGVDVTGVHGTQAVATGIAMIWVEQGSGQNSIALAPGANAAVQASEAEGSRPAFRNASYALFQLETPLPAIAALMRIACEEGAVTILDPAPAVTALPAEILMATRILTPNESEACILLGRPPERFGLDEAPQIAQALLDRLTQPQAAVLLKLGDRGSYYAAKSGARHSMDAVRVEKVIDTTAAGDVFNAGFAVALTEGLPVPAALLFATRAAAISVTRPGAQSSVPTRQEVLSAL